MSLAPPLAPEVGHFSASRAAAMRSHRSRSTVSGLKNHSPGVPHLIRLAKHQPPSSWGGPPAAVRLLGGPMSDLEGARVRVDW